MNQRRAPLELSTARLRLRQFTLADHPAYAAMASDEEGMRHIGAGGPIGSDDAWRSMAGMLGHWALLGYGMWAIELRGEFIGRVGFIDPPAWPEFEIGWHLARAHWGEGYAREAAEAALDIAFHALDRRTAISLIRPGNARSIKLAEALGARAEKRIEFLGGETVLYRHPTR